VLFASAGCFVLVMIGTLLAGPLHLARYGSLGFKPF
jgi:hypothetical protein